MHLNVRSLLHKLSEINRFTSTCRPAIISILETRLDDTVTAWLDDTVTDNEIQIEGYNVIRKDRDRQGGGVCTYIRQDLAFSERQDLRKDNLEAVWVEILVTKTKPILICTCYRPSKQNDFLELFEMILSTLRSDSEWFILGDFNICLKEKKSFLLKNTNRYHICLT